MHRLAVALRAAVTLAAVACASGTSSQLDTPNAPKYAAFSVPLSRDSAYLRRAAAPDFWAFAPYYEGQQDETSCSLASLTMLVNAARRDTPLGSADPLVTQPLLRQRVSSAVWEKGLARGGPGVTLEQLGVLARQSLLAFGVVPRMVQVTHIPAATREALQELRRALGASEASGADFMFVNFLARAYVGVGDYGHIAPVGAYDGEAQRVLILDPDRSWYEPYWIPDEIALSGMATPDAVTGEPRGYLYVAL
jgi:hypothetical protein